LVRRDAWSLLKRLQVSSYATAKETIKSIADIVEVIGQVVQLRKAGQNYVGLCPFHTEKEPSFTVSPAKQMFHCFGCKKGGDLFAFWMEYHGTTFPETIKELAERYNVPLSESASPSEERKQAEYREALFEVNEKACRFFHKILMDQAEGEPARRYLAGRSLSKSIVEEFRLGYAPDAWDSLVRFFGKGAGKLNIAAAAGLLAERKSGGYYDRFRKRVIFPIVNLRGRVVGFGGRVLDTSLPKYLNTPETPVFHKGSLLYGLAGALDVIRKEGRAVIVEGYMDVLALHDHGIAESVAALGTVLTDVHVRRLKGYAPELVLIFDSDEAGKKAALKSLPLFINGGLKGKAVVLPGGHDPDSFVNEQGASSLRNLIRNAGSLFDFHMEMSLSGIDGSIEAKTAAIKDVLSVLTGLRNISQQSLYVRQLSERVGIKEDVLWSELRNLKRGVSGDAERHDLSDKLVRGAAEKRFSRDLHFLNLLIHYPEAAQELKNSPWELLLSDASIIEIGNTFFQKYEAGGTFSMEGLLNSLESEKAREQLREGLLLPSFYSDQTVDLAIEELEKKIRQIEFARSLRKAREQRDLEGINRLLKQKVEGIGQGIRH
jgi:DNA primase